MTNDLINQHPVGVLETANDGAEGPKAVHILIEALSDLSQREP